MGYRIIQSPHRCRVPLYRSAVGEVVECDQCGAQWKCNGLYWRRLWFKRRKAVT